MEITEVKIFLKESVDRKLKAFATVTFDNVFVVRNIKIIEGSKGLFVAMPSRKMKEACPKCAFKNTIRSRFCNQCGAAIETSAQPVVRVDDASKSARQSEHRDIAHPITSEFRDYIQKKVTEGYEKERQSPTQPTSRRSQSTAGVAEASGFEEDVE